MYKGFLIGCRALRGGHLKKIETGRWLYGRVSVTPWNPPLLPSAAAMSAAAASASSADVVRPSGALPQPSGLEVQVILEQIKSLNTIDLLKVASAATTLAAKNVKKTPKSTSTSATSATSAPATKRGKKATKKSDVSEASDSEKPASKRSGAQLVKPRAWVTYVLQDAKANGWSAFTITQSKKDKVTGLKTETAVEVPASAPEAVEGEYVFADGKKFNHKYAMSLSKLYWSVKTQSGDRQDLYQAFDESYVAPSSAAEATTEAEEDD